MDIRDVISKRFEIVNDYEEELVIKCPNFHCDDFQGHFWINPNKGVYHCWLCEDKGSLKDFFDKYSLKHDILFNTERKKLIKSESRITSFDFKPIYLKDVLKNKDFKLKEYARLSLYYLLGRGLTSEDIVKNKICVVNYEEKSLEKLYGMFVVPCFDTRNFMNYWFSRRFIPGNKLRYWNPPGERKSVIWGINNWVESNNEDIVLCEGFMDAIKDDRCVALLSKDITDEQINILKIIEPKNNIIIALDKGEDKCQVKIGARLIKFGFGIKNIKVVSYEEDDKDDKKDFGDMSKNKIKQKIESAIDFKFFIKNKNL